MIIRVQPHDPHPNILFTVGYRDPKFEDETTIPASYAGQMNTLEALQDDGLGVETPRDPHAYDKAAWHSALISEVAFDARLRTVTCTMVDGSTVSWRFSSTGLHAGCREHLDRVIADVHGSSALQERERYGEEEEPYVQTTSYQASPEVQSPPAPPPKAHKRQKSLFSSFVAAVKGALSDSAHRGPTLPTSLPPLKIPSGFAHSHTRTSSTFSRTQRSPPLSPAVMEAPLPPVFELVIRPRQPIEPHPKCKRRTPSELLRHRARSGLVDLVRRYVYPMFSTTGSPSFAETHYVPDLIAQTYGFPQGLYPAWALRSLLRKTEDRLREMMEEANAYGYGQALRDARHVQEPPSLREGEDEDDAFSASTSATVSTETDGSSVHTPTDSPIRSPFTPSVASPLSSVARLSPLETKIPPQVPRSPSPPSPTFDFDLSTYHALGKLRTRILSILARMDSSPRQPITSSQCGSDLTILEIKSRRRAWSARDYVGGARLSLLGLATPFRSSPLARCEPVTAESLARIQAQAAQEPERPSLFATRSLASLPDLSVEFGVTVGVKAVTKEMDSRLFSVCEEDEENEDEEAAVGYSFGYGFDDYDDEAWRDMRDFDMESGLLAFPRPEAPPGQDPNATVYAHMHPMIRSRTQSMRQEHPRLPPTLLPHQRGPLAQREGTLSSDSLLCQPLNVKVPVPIMLDQDESYAVDDERGGEFTLSMDLPPPPRGWEPTSR